MGYAADALAALEPNVRKPRRQSADYMAPEEAESALQSLSKNIGGMVHHLGMALDTPGAIARGVLAGDPTSGLSWDADKRVTGEELLESYGLVDKDTNPYVRTAAGLATSIATDPLTWATGPLASLNAGGRAAKYAGLLDLAPIAAQKRLGAAAKSTLTGSYTDDALKALGPSVTDSAETLAVRPLVGPRYAQATTTARELVDVADNPSEALKKLTDKLYGMGMTFDEVADEPLGGMFGLGLIESNRAYTPPGGELLLDAMDLVGQKIGWSPAGRMASALFDSRVAGATDEGGQIMALKHSKELAKAKEAGARLASEHSMLTTDITLDPQAQQLLGAPSLMSEEGNALLTRLHENKPTAADLQIKQLTPGIDAAVTSWDRIRKHNITAAKQLGISLNEYSDRFGVLYSPRTGSAFDLGEEGGAGGSLYNTRTENAFSRSAGLIVPGGTDELREISVLPMVREHAQLQGKSPHTMEQVGQQIKQFLDARHGPDAVDADQATGLARIMYRLKGELPDKYPAFAEHPINMQARSIVSQEMARANARFVYDSLAEVADPRGANAIPGGGYKSMQAALNEVAGKVGLANDAKTGGLVKEVEDNIRQRLAAKFNTAPDQIDLNNVAVPEKLIERLGKVQDFYSKPKAQEELSGYFDQFTQLTKSFLLAWPSRHVRDAYSNAFSVWLETGSVSDSFAGFKAATHILNGDWDSAMPILRELPKYRNITSPDAIRRQFSQDVAGSGILTGMTQSDYLTSNRVGEVSQLVPGAQPTSIRDALSELVPDGTRTLGQQLSDFGTLKGITNEFQTANPLLNASAKINDFNDSMARMGGMIALMRQGADSTYAAQRMQAALVDYQSLSTFEREVMRKIFPWYSYQSRIGKYVVGELMRNPGGRYGQTIRALNTVQASDDETYVPSNLQQQFAFRIPEELAVSLGKTPDQNTTTFLTDFDLPGVDTLSMIVPGSYEDTLSNFAAQTNPFIQTFMEGATGRDAFTKKPLKESEEGIDRIYKFLSGDNRNLSPAAKAVFGNIPGLQRPTNLIGGMLDTRIPDVRQRALKQGFNAFTGMKVTDVDPAWQLRDARKQLEGRTDEYTREFATTYVPDELEAQAPPQVMEDIRLMQSIDKQYRDYSKTRPKRQPIYNPLLELFGGRQ